MSRSESRRVRGPVALTAVLQTFLLISSLVLTPALVIAQDEQAAAESAQPAAPALNLYVHPDPLKLTVGESQKVSAWTCEPGVTLPARATTRTRRRSAVSRSRRNGR